MHIVVEVTKGRIAFKKIGGKTLVDAGVYIGNDALLMGFTDKTWAFIGLDAYEDNEFYVNHLTNLTEDQWIPPGRKQMPTLEENIEHLMWNPYIKKLREWDILSECDVAELALELVAEARDAEKKNRENRKQQFLELQEEFGEEV